MSETCTQCYMKITDSTVRYQNQPYHGTCFVCWHCRKPLAGQTFQMRDDKKVCKDCNRTHYAKRCVACRNYIEGNAKYVTRDEGTYHSDCFVCARCRNPLAGKTFTEHEGKLVCDDCYHERYAKKCEVCKNVLEGNIEFVKYDEKFFHHECFVCYRCRKPLSGESFRIRGANRLCIPCADR
ncbi:four and a half LIM domains protein 2-like [Actinia tenebrosa]|uniref:Four and a half LIM domains protein 2-like n=1 Tax=Actinia tenebrosa TaxID=6105 RepID=A0A6P8IAU5_ACTTE|nr:four and a half LIM domains protein 2-like [Actinia tenebrosa]